MHGNVGEVLDDDMTRNVPWPRIRQRSPFFDVRVSGIGTARKVELQTGNAAKERLWASQSRGRHSYSTKIGQPRIPSKKRAFSVISTITVSSLVTLSLSRKGRGRLGTSITIVLTTLR